MATKKIKFNERGEAQLATWLPGKVVEKIYQEHEKAVEKAKKEGDMIPKFKQFFFDNYISPAHKKK